MVYVKQFGATIPSSWIPRGFSLVLRGTPPIPSLRAPVGIVGELLASGSIETYPLKTCWAQTIDAAYPQLRRDFHRLGVNLRSGTRKSPFCAAGSSNNFTLSHPSFRYTASECRELIFSRVGYTILRQDRR